MPHIAPLALDDTQGAAGEIAWLASATGFTANSMLTLSHRPEIAKAVLGLTIACTLGIARVSALGLLMTRLGGLVMFDAGVMSAKDWHLLAALDLVGALMEDTSQLVIQVLYLTGGNAQVDVVTVVTMVLSATMIVSAAFQGLARLVVLGSVRRRASRTQVAYIEREQEMN